MLWISILQLALILLSAMFSCIEVAVHAVYENRISDIQNGGKRSERLIKLLKDPERSITTIKLGITMSGYMASAYAAVGFSDIVVDFFRQKSIEGGWVQPVSVFVVTLILTYLTVVFGDLMPKRIAAKHARSIALGGVWLISSVGALFYPLVWLMSKSANLLLGIMGIDSSEYSSKVSEAEIRMLVDLGNQRGAIAPEECSVINNIFEFNDITIGRIVTHRTDVVGLWHKDSTEVWREVVFSSDHSLYPIYGETEDDVIGILSAKEYCRMPKNADKAEVMERVVSPPYFVPDSISADVLFRDMRKNNTRMAVVMDEYGGILGIVTINDLIELILGDLSDTPQQSVESIIQLSENTWDVGGAVPLAEINQTLGICLPSKDFDTIGGYIFAELGYIPSEQSFDLCKDNIHMAVVGISGHKVERVIITILPMDNMDNNSEV